MTAMTRDVGDVSDLSAILALLAISSLVLPFCPRRFPPRYLKNRAPAGLTGLPASL